tara:strand:- start:1146 stop:1499 length:354 start_codon:yes stop_codon:yes gene_type:complete
MLTIQCLIEIDPLLLAEAYMNVNERQTWHSACQDSRLIEEVWPSTTHPNPSPNPNPKPNPNPNPNPNPKPNPDQVWPSTMQIAVFTYRTELPVFPRGYCALIHRASHRLPDGRTQVR